MSRIVAPVLLASATACGAHAATPDAPVATRHAVAVDGGSLFVEEAGAGDPIVLVHGGLGDHRMWNGTFEALARDHRVIRYDHRGFGVSTRPTAAYSPVDDLVRVLDDRGVARAHLVGNSMGGTLIIDFALLHPERVVSLTVVASGPNGSPPPSPEDLATLAPIFDEHGAPDHAVALWLAHPMVAVTAKLPGPAALLRTMLEDNQTMFQSKFWPEEPMDPLAARRLGEIRAPTLVVIGDRDWPAVQRSAELTATGIPGARKLVMAGADHLPQLDDPAAFEAALREFLPRR